MRTYVASLLNFFKGVEVQYTDQTGNIISSTVPVTYVSKEKSDIFQSVSNTQHLTGNVNILPRAVLSLISVQRDDTRQTNRNLKINRVRRDSKIEFAYNSVAYSFIFEYKIYCRGMNEATMLLEEIAPRFNPNCSLDVYDTDNLDEPTRVPVKLVDINIAEYEELSETSSNIFNVSCTVQLEGQLYSPINIVDAVNHLGINLYKETKHVSYYDFDSGFFEHSTPFTVEGFNLSELKKGDNELEVLYKAETDENLSFEFTVDQGDCIIRETNRNKAKISCSGKFVSLSCVVRSRNELDGVKTVSRDFVVN